MEILYLVKLSFEINCSMVIFDLFARGTIAFASSTRPILFSYHNNKTMSNCFFFPLMKVCLCVHILSKQNLSTISFVHMRRFIQ
jgi:hypothetical protein